MSDKKILNLNTIGINSKERIERIHNDIHSRGLAYSYFDDTCAKDEIIRIYPDGSKEKTTTSNNKQQPNSQSLYL